MLSTDFSLNLPKKHLCEWSFRISWVHLILYLVGVQALAPPFCFLFYFPEEEDFPALRMVV